MNYNDLKISDEVIAAVEAGRKIDAIKILREETGLGLKEAKDVVDGLARSNKGDAYVAPSMEEKSGGGLLKTVVLIAIILGVYFYFFAG